MRFSSFSTKLILLLCIVFLSALIAYAATPISNPLCTLTQVSNNDFNPYEMVSISGDGNRAVAGGGTELIPAQIWNLSTNTLIKTLPNAASPVMDYDGSRTAFYSNINPTNQNADGSYELFLWDSNIDTLSQLSNFNALGSVMAPDISADGTKIVFPLVSATGYKYYIWREGSGVQTLVSSETEIGIEISSVRISADGNYAVFVHDGNLTGDDPQNEGAFYRKNLSTQSISYIPTPPDMVFPVTFMAVDGDASRIAYQYAPNIYTMWISDISSGLRSFTSTSSTNFPYQLPLGFSDDGNRLFFGSTGNPTGENPDGSFEHFIYEWSSDSVRQVTSKTGIPIVPPSMESLGANGQTAALLIPSGEDYDSHDSWAWDKDLELFKATCPATSTSSLTAPSNLRTTAVTQNIITLAWNDNSSDETYFRLERSPNGSTWTEVAILNADATVRNDPSLTCGTSYHYRVRAYRSIDAAYSSYSNVLTTATSACDNSLPAPSNLRTTSVNPTSIDLAWNDNSSNETSFRLERSPNGSSSWSEIASLSANVTSRTDSTLSCGTTYYYRVRAYRSSDAVYSSYSNVLTTTTTACVGLTAPSNLRTTSIGQTSIFLAWNDNSNTETNFMLERSLNGSSWTLIYVTDVNALSYTNSSLTCGTSYYYRVRAYRDIDVAYSSYSNVLTVTTSVCIPAFNAPSNLRTTSVGEGSVTLAWNDNSNTETNFKLERSLDGSSWTEIVSLSANVISRTDSSLTCGTNYHYRVRAYRSSDLLYTSYSNVYLARTNNCSLIAAPSELRIANYDGDSITLAWIDNSTNASYFKLERSLNGSTWAEVASVPYYYIPYMDWPINCGTSYYYRIRGYRSTGNNYSAYSNIISGTTWECLQTPTNFRATATTPYSISLAWDTIVIHSPNHSLERRLAGGTWSVIPLATLTTYTDTGLSCATNYEYRIRTQRDGQYTAYANLSTSTAPCPVAAPSNPSHSSSQYSLQLSWTDNAYNETDFELQRNNNGVWQTITTLPSNTTSFTDMNLLCFTDYNYRIRAFNSSTGIYSIWAYVAGTTAACPALVASTLNSTTNLNSINLSWTVDNTAQSFTLSYSNGVQWIPLGNFNTATTSFNHAGLASGQSYQYRVQSHRQQDNVSIVSNTVSYLTLACPPLAAPSAPTVLNASTSLVTLQIPVMPSGASSMNLERSLDGITWASIGLASGSYSDVTVSCGMSFYYRLVAFRASDGQYSPASPSAQATTQACPVYISQIVGIYRAGNWSFVDSNATASPTSLFSFGDAAWQPLVGDWDGDGVDGIGLYQNGEFILRSIVAGQIQESRFSLGTLETGWQALAGDWNGDGIDSIGLYKDGVFILSDDNINLNYRFNLGDGANWKAVAGDWDGNGTDGVALYQNGLWLLVDSAINPVSQMVAFGPAQAGWLPVVGDWDGNGTDTIGLYQNGLWRLRLSSNSDGMEISVVYGTAGDIPLSTYQGGIPSADLSQTQASFIQPIIVPEATAEN